MRRGMLEFKAAGDQLLRQIYGDSADKELITYRIPKGMEVGFKKVVAYFYGIPQYMGLNPKKDLLLVGPPSSGKTFILMIASHLLRQHGRGFRIVPCREIAMEYAKKGISAISQFGTDCFKTEPATGGGRLKTAPITVAFDDMGQEPVLAHFGKEINVMEAIIADRYDLWISMGMRTLITTNLDADGINELYGARIASRMRQMFEKVVFDAEDFRI